MKTRQPKDTFSLINRTRSIKHDAQFVEYCSTKFPLPIVPNERAGTWYVNPLLREHGKSVYFKSTDGHTGQWDFSIKRLNLHILPFIAEHRGIIIVDATRRGKRFPDSLSKTIPIWCCVLNNLVQEQRNRTGRGRKANWDVDFHSSPAAVATTERAQIIERISSMTQKALSCSLDLEEICKWIDKPLRPIWIHPSSAMFSEDAFWTVEELNNLPFWPVVCISASISSPQDQNDFRQEPIFPIPPTFDYVQGAADDSESWCPGITAAHFWKVSDLLTDAISLSQLQTAIQDAIESTEDDQVKNDFDWIGNTSLAIGNRSAGNPDTCWNHFDFVINCGSKEYDLIDPKKYLCLDIHEGKKGQHQLFASLPIAIDAVKEKLGQRILIHCQQGIDRSVGITIAILLRYLNESGSLSLQPESPKTKQDVMNMLLLIKKYRPAASPTRATMKRLNLYFCNTV